MRVYSVSGVRMYVFRVEGVHYYFAVKTEQGWSVAGGKLSGRQVIIHGEAARSVADAINAICREMGVDRRIEVKYGKNGVPYIYLTNEDLRQLGIK